MRAANRSSRLSCQSNYLRMFRIVLAITVAIFPVFGLARLVIEPGTGDPLWMRFAISATAAVFLSGSYRCSWVRARIAPLTSILLCVIAYWYVGLAYRSGFSAESATALIVVFAAVGVGTSFWIDSFAFVSVFMTSMMAAIGIAVYSLDAPGISPASMMLACFGVALVIFIAVTSRAKADEDMYAQHGLLRSLFDESADAHILLDSRSGSVIDFNQAALDLFGVSAGMLSDRQLDWKTGLRVLDEERPIDERFSEQREQKCIARGGRIFWAEVSTRSLHVDDLDITLLKVTDITQKREAARMAILEARRAGAVAEISAALSDTGADESDALQVVARTLTRSQADLCIVCCVSDDGQTVTPVAVSHRNPQTEDLVREWAEREPIRVGEGLIGKVVAGGESIMMEDAPADMLAGHASSDHYRFVRDAHLHAVVVHPLTANGEIVGAMLLSRGPQRSAFSRHDLAFFSEVVEKTGLAIANARLMGTIKRSEARFRSLVQNSSDLILLLDDKARFCYVSPSAKRVLGYEPDEILGERIFALAHPEDVAGLLSESNYFREGKDLTIHASRFRHSNGDWRWLEAYAVNMLEDENVQGVVINARDVTERFRYEDELRNARDVAEEMVRLKDAFLANMSHEIRTPLTAIIGFAAVLADELDEQHREFVGHIHSNGTRLMEALNSVLDLARLEAGGVALELVRVDIHQAVSEALSAFRALADARGLTLEASLNLDDPTLWLDARCFDRVLTNLLGNAIRFTEAGHVRVDVRPDGDYALISVEDTGIGIGEEFLPHLFKPFRQESSGFSRSHEGTGLGLTITQRLVQVMGGTIEVESRRGVGSTFRLRFPQAGAEGEPRPEATLIEAEATPRAA